MHGFTCGFGDLLLIPKAEKSRRHKLKETDNLGNKINARFVGFDEDGGKLFIHVLIITLIVCLQMYRKPQIFMVTEGWWTM